MTNELMTIDTSQIIVRSGVIQFDDYERIRKEALDLAEQIEQVEVTEENTQVSKKMIAAVNRRVKELEAERIRIKKEMLRPYEDFEAQVKDIVSIVKDAENLVRDQVREMEEKERDEKRKTIEGIFNKRIKQYSFKDTFTFEQFLKSKHLNKSMSLTSVESEMVDWLEGIETDLTAIKALPNSEEVFAEYLITKDLSMAIRIVNEREERKKQAEAVVKPVKTTVEYEYQFTVSEKNALALEMFLQLKEIEYKMIKVVK